MKEFKQHQKDAVFAKMHDLSCVIFYSCDNGDTWCGTSSDALVFYPSDLYVAVSSENEEAAIACLIEGKTVESTYCGERLTISRRSIFENNMNWLVFSNGRVEVKKDPIVMWVAATNEYCSRPHSSCAELAKRLLLDHEGEITDGQVVSGFTFNMIKVEL